MIYFVTGAAGFIGSQLTDRLLATGATVVGYDNLSTGKMRFLEPASASANFRFVQGDVLDTAALARAMKGADFVFHLAANADVRFGTEHPERDLEQNTVATFNVLEAMRSNGIRRMAFSSTGSVYGEPDVFPTPEDAPFPLQTSLYGASKLAAEGMIEAYCEGFGFQAYIFRFVSILGERYTHGHVFDFCRKLWADPTRLDVLGNGQQRKSYLYVHDCIDAMLLAIETARGKVNVLNLGTEDACRVERLDRLDYGASRRAPGVDVCGRRARLGRRQPVHPARYAAHTRARLEAEAHHSRRRVAHGRLAGAKPLGLRAAPMKLAVFGLWHLGTVTAACAAAAGVETVGVDLDRERIARLSAGEPPLHEPGLAELVRSGFAARTLTFSADVASVSQADVVWVCHDTPVDDEDNADTGAVIAEAEMLFAHLKDGAVVLVSAQLPVGSVAALERRFAAQANGRAVSFACSPENLRLGKAIEVFRNPGRIVVGVRDERAREILEPLLSKFCAKLIWMSVESAEMVKHGLNSFLATSVAFANEMASVCERAGADASEVERGLRSDPRVGPNAYIRAGAAFAGGTLARDVNFLRTLAHEYALALPLMDGVVASNRAHGQWALSQLRRALRPLSGRMIGVLGLAYKPGTSALRRSPSIELIKVLASEGAQVQAFDPHVPNLPDELRELVRLCPDARAVASGADALVVANECFEFRDLSADDVAKLMTGRIVLDPGRFLGPAFATNPKLTLISVGRSA